MNIWSRKYTLWRKKKKVAFVINRIADCKSNNSTQKDGMSGGQIALNFLSLMLSPICNTSKKTQRMEKTATHSAHSTESADVLEANRQHTCKGKSPQRYRQFAGCSIVHTFLTSTQADQRPTDASKAIFGDGLLFWNDESWFTPPIVLCALITYPDPWGLSQRPPQQGGLW